MSTLVPGPSMDVRSVALSMPEILQEICRYLDKPALIHASQVSRQFWACCSPLLWVTIPEHAWRNDYFRTNWHQHASRILVLQCAADVNLKVVSAHCKNLVSLDVSRVQEGLAASANRDNTQTMASERRNDRPGNNNNHPAKIAMEPPVSYDSFVRMTEDLIRVLDSNRNLRCLQMRPHGRFPTRLLNTLSRMEKLQILSLNAWHDFQEHSLQLIIESCPRLSHLSLGENDFTRFTLENLGTPTPIKQGANTFIRLERYDDPLKSRNGPAIWNQDPLEIQSKHAVLYTLSPAQDSEDLHVPYPVPLPLQHQYQPSVTPLQSQITSLSLHQTGLRQEFLVNLTTRCPHLEHLSMLNGWGFYPSSRFATILSRSCPGLTKLEFRDQALDLQDEFFTTLCQHFPRLEWIHAGLTGFSRGAMEAVQLHCKWIASLNLDGARGIPSQAVDQILRTCSTLTGFSARGVVLNARHLSQEPSWSCHGLETLVLDIEIYAVVGAAYGTAQSEAQEDVPTVRKRFYKQLAELTRLRCLGLGGGHRVGGTDIGVDLTLASGLERLHSLHCLERLDIRRMVRTQGESDLAWMAQHWPRLRYLEVSKIRSYIGENDKTHKAIEWLSRSRPGMTITQH